MRVINVQLTKIQTVNTFNGHPMYNLGYYINPYVSIDDDEFSFSILLQEAEKEFKNLILSKLKAINELLPVINVQFLLDFEAAIEDDDFNSFSLNNFEQHFPELYELYSAYIELAKRHFILEGRVICTEANY